MTHVKTPDLKTVRLQEELGSTYTIVEKIGGGAMGDVYLANHKTLGGKWAIKILAEELARDPMIVERFVREAQIEANLQHPNIVKVFDIGKKGEFQFLVMTFVEGEDLDARMKRVVPMDPSEAVTIALHVTRALECAHEHSIIHRDLKPSNIRIDHYGTVVVMDFGIARILDAGQGRTALGARIGTPLYMSPEQSAGRMVDHRSDLYSLGVILYELIAGHNPFYNENPYAIGVKHLTLTPPPLSEVRSSLKPGLSEIVAKLLAKDPSDRYQTATEAREALTPFGGGVEIRTPLPVQPAGRPAELTTTNLIKLGPLDAIPHRIPEPEEDRDLTPAEKTILRLVDGVRNMREVVEQAPCDSEIAVSALETLQLDGFVYTEIPPLPEPLEPTISAPAAKLPPPPAPDQAETQLDRDKKLLGGIKKAFVSSPKMVRSIAAAVLLVVAGIAVWALWPSSPPQALQVDASPFAQVAIKTEKGEVLAKENTPFQTELPPGIYILEFVNGTETRSQQITIGSKPLGVIRAEFWNADRVKNLIETYR
jgi:serine/threonine protein kinase